MMSQFAFLQSRPAVFASRNVESLFRRRYVQYHHRRDFCVMCFHYVVANSLLLILDFLGTCSRSRRRYFSRRLFRYVRQDMSTTREHPLDVNLEFNISVTNSISFLIWWGSAKHQSPLRKNKSRRESISAQYVDNDFCTSVIVLFGKKGFPILSLYRHLSRLDDAGTLRSPYL